MGSSKSLPAAAASTDFSNRGRHLFNWATRDDVGLKNEWRSKISGSARLKHIGVGGRSGAADKAKRIDPAYWVEILDEKHRSKRELAPLMNVYYDLHLQNKVNGEENFYKWLESNKEEIYKIGGGRTDPHITDVVMQKFDEFCKTLKKKKRKKKSRSRAMTAVQSWGMRNGKPTKKLLQRRWQLSKFLAGAPLPETLLMSNLIETGAIKRRDGPGVMYVVCQDEHVYIAQKVLHNVHHSSFLCGSPCLAAGHVKALNNREAGDKRTLIWNDASGHYKPGELQLVNIAGVCLSGLYEAHRALATTGSMRGSSSEAANVPMRLNKILFAFQKRRTAMSLPKFIRRQCKKKRNVSVHFKRYVRLLEQALQQVEGYEAGQIPAAAIDFVRTGRSRAHTDKAASESELSTIPVIVAPADGSMLCPPTLSSLPTLRHQLSTAWRRKRFFQTVSFLKKRTHAIASRHRSRRGITNNC